MVRGEGKQRPACRGVRLGRVGAVVVGPPGEVWQATRRTSEEGGTPGASQVK